MFARSFYSEELEFEGNTISPAPALVTIESNSNGLEITNEADGSKISLIGDIIGKTIKYDSRTREITVDGESNMKVAVNGRLYVVNGKNKFVTSSEASVTIEYDKTVY